MVDVARVKVSGSKPFGTSTQRSGSIGEHARSARSTWAREDDQRARLRRPTSPASAAPRRGRAASGPGRGRSPRASAARCRAGGRRSGRPGRRAGPPRSSGVRWCRCRMSAPAASAADSASDHAATWARPARRRARRRRGPGRRGDPRRRGAAAVAAIGSDAASAASCPPGGRRGRLEVVRRRRGRDAPAEDRDVPPASGSAGGEVARDVGGTASREEEQAHEDRGRERVVVRAVNLAAGVAHHGRS